MNPPSGSRIVQCGQTDRHDEANSRFSQFCERILKKLINTLKTEQNLHYTHGLGSNLTQ